MSSALALACILNLLRVDEALEQAVERRLDVIASELAADVLVGLDIGLPLEAMDNLPGIVQRMVDGADGIATVGIVDCSGRPVVSLARNSTAQPVAPAVLARWLATGQPRWRRFDRDLIAVAVPLTHSYGGCAGAVVVQQGADAFQATRQHMVAGQLRAGLIAALLALPAAFLLARTFRPRERLLGDLAADLDGLGSTASPSQSRSPSLPAASRLATTREVGRDLLARELIDGYAAARPALIEVGRDEAAQMPAAVPVVGHETSGGCAEAAGPLEHGAQSDLMSGPAEWLSSWFGDPLRRGLAITALTLLAALTAVSLLAAANLRDALLPELGLKARAQAGQMARMVQRAIDLGVPANALVGFDQVFDDLRGDQRDLMFVALVDETGAVLQQAGRLPDAARAWFEPLRPQGSPDQIAQRRIEGHLLTGLALQAGKAATVPTLYLGHAEAALAHPLLDGLADLLVVLLVALLLAFEIMLMQGVVNAESPMRIAIRALQAVAERRFSLLPEARVRDALGSFGTKLEALVQRGARRVGVSPRELADPRLAGVRLLAFLFVFAEELARPIMPVHFAAVASLDGGHLGAGFVMAAHLAAVAIAMPLGSLLYPRLGRRPMYLGGALLASAGLFGAAFASDIGTLIAWRCLSGIGYAATFVACQGFVIEATDVGNRGRGSAAMVGGIMLADICGPAIGGIVAARIGAEATFATGAIVAGLAAIMVGWLMGRRTGSIERPAPITLSAFVEVVRTPGLIVLLLLAAVPAKLVLGGLLYYLTPVVLAGLDSPPGQIGRILMLYGLVGLLAGPLLARLTDRLQKPIVSLVIGGLISGLGALPLAWGVSAPTVALAVAALGLGQALSIPALMVAVLSMAGPAVARHGQGPVMAVMRLLERLGGAAGPLIAGGLAASFGASMSMSLVGGYALASALLLGVTLMWPTLRSKEASP